jgi:hypothetical protein
VDGALSDAPSPTAAVRFQNNVCLHCGRRASRIRNSAFGGGIPEKYRSFDQDFSWKPTALSKVSVERSGE